MGHWRNIEDLELCLSLPELELILRASRDKEQRQNKFLAALQGIDLDKDKVEDTQEAFDRVQRRVQAKLSGASEEQIAHGDFGFGFDIEE